MRGSIVCGVDGSGPARGAARVARVLSAQLGLPLLFVRVLEPVAAVEAPDVPAKRLQRLVECATPVDCSAGWLAETGHPADRLIAVAAEVRARMIVVGSHGPRSALLGSISAEVSRRAPCPVVVVPPGADTVTLNDGVSARTGVRSHGAPISSERDQEPSERPRRRSSADARHVAIIYAAIGAALLATAVLSAYGGAMPTMGWVAFAIFSIIVFALGTVATVSIPRMRVSPPEPAVAADGARRLLVIADARCNQVALCDEIVRRLDGAVAVRVVVPVRVSHLHFLTNDEEREQRVADYSMLTSVGLLQRRGVAAAGTVGTDKPLESMSDALGSFAATSVLLAIPPDDETYWLERGLLEKARELTSVPVEQVVIPSATESL